jgi:ZIP family zinc transporter
VAVAIAIHNIPEGIAVAVPIYYATKNRRLAFGFGALSGLAEPVGALLGYAILAPFITQQLLGIVFGVVAGVMVFISIDSLLPAARAYGNARLAIYGMIAGMMVMAVSLVLFMF